jgi:hypothetical protein
MPKLLLLLFLFIVTGANAQTDTAKSNVPETWKKMHFGFRAATGIQRNFYTEFGFSFQRFIYEARHGFMAYTWYTAFEWTPPSKGKEQVNGVKLGAEMVNNGGSGGVEVKYLFNSRAEDVVITPKFGFGMGFVTLFYGYNLSTRKNPFPNIGKHQFSLAINTNILHHHWSEERKKRRNRVK